MSFAEEVAAAKAAPKSAQSETPAQNDAANTEATAEQHFAMPAHGEVHPEQQNDAVDLSETQGTPAPVKEGKIKIADEVFDDVEAALKYATDLKLTLLEKEAYEKGKQDASQKPAEAVVEPDWTDEIERELFENPKEAIKKLHKKATEEAEKILAKREEEKAKAQAVEAQRKKTWDSFYHDNTDLSSQSAQEVVNGILQRDWHELGPMPAEKALPILAKRAREFIASLKETQLPTTVLQSNKVVTTKSGIPSTATNTQKKASPLDFISQVNKHRKRADIKENN